MTVTSEADRRRRRATIAVAALTVAGHALSYAVTVLAARSLAPPAFENYAVAAAIFMVLVHVAPLGLDKFALRVIPVLAEHGEHARVGAFARYAASRVRWVAWGGAVAVALVAGVLHGGDLALVIGIACLGLSTASLVHLRYGVVAALGAPARAAFALRVVVPGVTLVVFALLASRATALGGGFPMVCWAAGWLSAYVVLGPHRHQEALGSSPDFGREDATWIAQARPFWLYAMAVAVMNQAGILALEVAAVPPAAVGGYVAASATVGTLVAIVASTNAVYARHVAMAIDRGDGAALRHVLRARLAWILPLALAALPALWIFAEDIVAWYGPDFVAEGAPALRVLAVAVPLSLASAMAPFELKIRRRNQAILAITAGAALLQLAGLLLLVGRFGATGAAVSFAAASVVMFTAFAVVARRTRR